METHLTALVLMCLVQSALSANEFSFELEDKTKTCFFEQVKKGDRVAMEYQVIKGLFFWFSFKN